ncbi:transcription factor tfiiib complex subunit brf1 [Ophiobolus disseminans]|uniref:Transcription factor tfiiib complex subunit brf1 n=1 Tax=Ophiobolus disseminans TaxID=1469910 RepID=A0A6A7A5Y7_9PLEO|nr:transcription factor tfiiib complex subunit brf1 [Ophiobolus disseminans]
MPGPVAPRQRLRTLDLSTKKLNPTYARPRVHTQQASKSQEQVYNCCPTPNVSSDSESTICYNCGTIHASSTIVSEVTFGETAGGAAMVEGGFIGENQRHANSMGGTMRGLGGMASREQAEYLGKQEIEKIGHSLFLPATIMDQALRWYKLAMNHSFIQGRRMRNVAAVALYLTARRQKENTLMLMDLAEKIQVNVWQLGDTYKAFLKLLGEKDPAQLIGNPAVQAVEPLMLKYCRKLEFGDESHKVANDACKLLRRMNRDWMVQGRQPAGLCGACIILAARMNNFRRTVREVVYVVKVADTTINNRLYEYKKTPSSALTVNQFREFGHRVKVTTLPPAIWRREQKEERREKRRAALEADPDSAEVLEDSSDGGEPEAGPSTAPTRTSKRRKTNNGASQEADPQDESSGTRPADGAEVDALDGNDENLLEDIDSVMIEAGADANLEIEQEIESEVTHTIKDWEAIFKEFATNENHSVLKSSGWTAQQMARAELDRRDTIVNISPDIAEDEFADDPDVANCILGPEEVRIKERIWITENEEWLREQQKKLLQAELDLAEDKPKKPKQKRKHHQMGDGSVLEGVPATSAADAAHKMLKKRSKQFSNHINYDRLKELFPMGETSATQSPGSGTAASPANAARTPVEVQDVDAEGEDDEEYEAPQQFAADDEEDLEHNYLSDENEGFDYGDDF